MPKQDAAALATFHSHRALIHSVAAWYFLRLPYSIPRDDILAAADVGLWEAARAHHNKSPSHFARVARLRMRGAIADFLRMGDWLPRRARTGFAASFRQVHIDGFAPGDADHLLQLTVPPEAETAFFQEEALDKLRAAIARAPLRKRERIIVSRFLVGQSRAEIALDLGISQPRMSQLWRGIVTKLRTVLVPTAPIVMAPGRSDSEWKEFAKAHRHAGANKIA